MPLRKDYAVASTGANATYHVIQQVTLDYQSEKTVATVASFVSKELRDSGKFALYTQPIMFDGMPAEGQTPRDFTEAELIADVPPDGAVSPYPNRYVFAGAQIVD